MIIDQASSLEKVVSFSKMIIATVVHFHSSGVVVSLVIAANIPTPHVTLLTSECLQVIQAVLKTGDRHYVTVSIKLPYKTV